MLSPQGLRRRSQLLQATRSFFYERSYVEVDTPLRLAVLIPESTIVPFASEEALLHTSPELCMKRLLARGADRLFQLCHCFRREERGRLHEPEFTLLEWYRQGWDYRDLMVECEALVCALARQFAHWSGLGEDGRLVHQGCRVSLQPPWQRLTVAEAFVRHAGVEVAEALAWGRYEEILVEKVEPNLGREKPVFLCDYPVELAALARRSPCDPRVAERFELYIAGMELANGFSELCDSGEQRQRFVVEIEKIRAQGREAVMPEAFLADLDLIGEAAGVAMGFDRLALLLMGSRQLTDVLPF